MAKQPKAKRVLQEPKYPGSIPRAELRKAIRKLADARRRRKLGSVNDASK